MKNVGGSGMKSRYWLCALASFGVLAGCTTELQVAPIDIVNKTPKAGWPYSLPYARFDLAVTRRLEDCLSDGIVVATTFIANPLFEADSKHSYVIDHRSLSSDMKTSSLSLERHDNGMLKLIGAASEDMTAKVIVNTVTGVINLAKLTQALGGQSILSTTPAAPPTTACNQKTLRVVQDFKTQKRIVESDTKTLNDSSRRLKALFDAVAGLQRPIDPSIQTQILAQAHTVVQEQIKLDRETDKLKEHLEKLTITDRKKWPSDGVTTEEIWEFPKTRFKDWVDSTDKLESNELRLTLVANDGDLSGVGPGGTISAADASNSSGIRFRDPVPGRLMVQFCGYVEQGITPPYEGARPASLATCGSEPKKPYELRGGAVAAATIPQLGRAYFLPFRNGPFEDNELKAAFRTDGSLVTASYGEKSAVAEKASATFAQTTGQLAQAPKDMLDAQRALIEADTALKKAQLANMEANAALERSRSSSR